MLCAPKNLDTLSTSGTIFAMEPETQPTVVVMPQSSPAEQPAVAQAEPMHQAPTVTSPAADSPSANPPVDTPLDTPQKEVEYTWDADEFEQTVRTPTWYGALTLGAIITAILTFIVSGKDFFSAGAVLLAILGLGFLASRKPRQIQIGVDDQGLYVGHRFYAFHDYRSFSIEQQGQPSALFMPLKRFAPPLVVLLDPLQVDDVSSYIATFLPLQEHKPDLIEKLMSRLHL